MFVPDAPALRCAGWLAFFLGIGAGDRHEQRGETVESALQERGDHLFAEPASEARGTAAIQMMTVLEKIVCHPVAGIDDGDVALLTETSQIALDASAGRRHIPTLKQLAFGHQIQDGGDAFLPAQREQVVQRAVLHRRDVEVLQFLRHRSAAPLPARLDFSRGHPCPVRGPTSRAHPALSSDPAAAATEASWRRSGS